MAVSILVAALAVLFVAQPGLSRPEQSSVPDLQAMVREFQTSIDKTVAEAKKNLNLPENPDGAAIVKAIREQSNKAEKALNDMRAKLEESVKKNPELSGAIDKLKAKIDEASANLKKENPEVHANAQKVADTMKSAYESVSREMERLTAEVNKKGGLRDDLDSLLKNLIDRGTAAAKEFQSKVQEAVAKKSK